MSHCRCEKCAVRRLLGINDATTPERLVEAVNVLTTVLGQALVSVDIGSLGNALTNVVDARNDVVRRLNGNAETDLAQAEAAGHG